MTRLAYKPPPTFSADEAVLVHPVQSSVIVVHRVADVENLENHFSSVSSFFFVKCIIMEILGWCPPVDWFEDPNLDVFPCNVTQINHPPGCQSTINYPASQEMPSISKVKF